MFGFLENKEKGWRVEYAKESDKWLACKVMNELTIHGKTTQLLTEDIKVINLNDKSTA